MKKLFSLFLALTMLLTLCACGGQTPNGTAESTGNTTHTTPSTQTPSDTEGTATEATTETTGKRPSRLPEETYQQLPASCEHGFSEADCTTPKTCHICGFELDDPLGHDFIDGICTRCGAAEGAEDEAAE